MKKRLTVLLLLFNGIVVLAQIAPAKKTLPHTQVFKPLLQPGLGNMQDTIKRVQVAVDSADALYRHLPGATEGNFLALLNGNIISYLNGIAPENIVSFTVVKDQDKPQRLFNISRFGLIYVGLKNSVNIDALSFIDIGKLFAPKGKVRFALNGYFVDDESLLIERAAITRVDQSRDDYRDPFSPVILNIWTVNPDVHNSNALEKRPTDKSGVVYIRGLASK